MKNKKQKKEFIFTKEDALSCESIGQFLKDNGVPMKLKDLEWVYDTENYMYEEYEKFEKFEKSEFKVVWY